MGNVVQWFWAALRPWTMGVRDAGHPDALVLYEWLWTDGPDGPEVRPGRSSGRLTAG